jgi:RNA polymerase sigma factor (sigma-70 family)
MRHIPGGLAANAGLVLNVGRGRFWMRRGPNVRARNRIYIAEAGRASARVAGEGAVTSRTALPPDGFCDFFRTWYRPLVRDVIFAGGHHDEAEDAVSVAMTEVFQRWDTIENPQAYARRVAINYAIRNRQRGLLRITERLVERGDVPLEGDLDPGLLIWEQREWVTLLLKSLSPAERQVLAFVVDAFRPAEIAQLLGKTEAAVRQNLHTARKRLARRLGETGHHDTREEDR